MVFQWFSTIFFLKLKIFPLNLRYETHTLNFQGAHGVGGSHWGGAPETGPTDGARWDADWTLDV